MKPVNLASVIIANKNLSTENRDRLFNAWGISPKPNELVSLESLINGLSGLSPNSPDVVVSLLGGCFFGFIIPRISKEFDCLWIGADTIVNVELKSQDVGVAAIQKQLIQNQQYLRPLQKDILSFTYDSSTRNCYTIDSSNNLSTCTLTKIGKALQLVHEEVLYVDDIETLSLRRDTWYPHLTIQMRS